MDVLCLRQTTQQNHVVQWIIYLFFESEFLNLFSSYEFMMNWKQYHSNVFYAGAKREFFVYPAMSPHLPEHLTSRYVILYACVTMVLDSIQVQEPQAEKDNLKLFWFRPNVCSQYIDNIHN